MDSLPVRVEETADGVSIHVDRAALIGFESILIDAKFQPGCRADVLLSPWVRAVVEATMRARQGEPMPAPPELQQRIEAIVDGYRGQHAPDANREELVRVALLPFKASNG